jgi:hypothetical protein
LRESAPGENDRNRMSRYHDIRATTQSSDFLSGDTP